MYNQTGFAALVAITGLIALADADAGHAQVVGAVQYPPLSIGEDAQPPPPARMVAKTASPRLELSFAPSYPPYRWNQDANWHPVQRAPLSGSPPELLSTGSGSN
jgi:hypothetical protein